MKKINNTIKLAVLFSFILFALACSKDTSSGGVNVIKNPPKDPTQIVTQSNYISVDNSQNSFKLYASVIPSEQAHEPLIYTSSNQSIAQVDNDGNVTVKGEGIANITVALKNNQAVYKNIIINSYIPVQANPDDTKVRAVYVDKTHVSLSISGNNTYKLDAGVRPIDASNKALSFISTDTRVATVDDLGTIKAVNGGTAVIIAFAKVDPSKFVQITVDVKGQESGSGIEFSPPAGVSPIDLAGNPLSLIAKYKILEYQINNEGFKKASDDSNLRVNVILDNLPVVDILMYTKLNGNEVRLIQRKDITDYNMDIGAIFTSLGANITGEYTMEFTLKPENYSQFYKQGVVSKGDTLVLKIGKVEDYVAAAGLGNDITFDPAQVPIEEGSSDGGALETPEQGSGGNSQAVTDVDFNITTYTPYKVNETFSISATVLPVNAEDKTLTWESSNDLVATVDDSGNVTIHSNGSAKITATARNGVSGELVISPNTNIEDFALDIDTYDLILGLVDEYKITYSLYPYIIDPQTVTPKFSSDNEQVATVGEDGVIRAVGEGETIIRVMLAGKEREFFVTVLPKYAANTPVESITLTSDSGIYNLNDATFRLQASVEPPTAADKRLRFKSLNTKVAEVNETSGLVTLRATGNAVIRVSAYNNDTIYKDFNLIVETTPTKVIFERLDYGLVLNEERDIPVILEGNPSNRSVVYTSSEPTIATVDETTGRVRALNLGTTTITAVAANGMKDSYDLHVYTPADINNLSSLEGTYDIVDFTQTNGTLDIGTKNYGGVERMLGEVTIKVENNKVKMISKIQMNSSTLDNYNSIGSAEAKTGLFQTVVFDAADFKAGGFGSTGSLTKGQVSAENGVLKIYQQFNMTVVISVTVKVNTWIKKKSNTVKTLDPKTFIWTKDGAAYNQKAHAVKYFSAASPSKEPYYAYGRITK